MYYFLKTGNAIPPNFFYSQDSFIYSWALCFLRNLEKFFIVFEADFCVILMEITFSVLCGRVNLTMLILPCMNMEFFPLLGVLILSMTFVCHLHCLLLSISFVFEFWSNISGRTTFWLSISSSSFLAHRNVAHFID